MSRRSLKTLSETLTLSSWRLGHSSSVSSYEKSRRSWARLWMPGAASRCHDINPGTWNLWTYSRNSLSQNEEKMKWKLMESHAWSQRFHHGSARSYVVTQGNTIQEQHHLLQGNLDSFGDSSSFLWIIFCYPRPRAYVNRDLKREDEVKTNGIACLVSKISSRISQKLCRDSATPL